MRFYSVIEVEGTKERLRELREMRDSNYQNMSSEKAFPRKVELMIMEAQLNPHRYLGIFNEHLSFRELS